MRPIDADALMKRLKKDPLYPLVERYNIDGFINAEPTVDAVPVVMCKNCTHNPKLEWFGCPMASLNEKQRPETAWCWKGEREDGERHG